MRSIRCEGVQNGRLALFLVVDGHGTHDHQVTATMVVQLHEHCAGSSWRADETALATQPTGSIEQTGELLALFLIWSAVLMH